MDKENIIEPKIDEPKHNVIYKKYTKFKKERGEILHTVYGILGINEQNKVFYAHDLDNDINKQNKIMDLVNIIPQYFKVSSWVVFKKNTKVERPYISLVRCIFRDMNINYTCSSCKIKNSDKKFINSTIYILDKL